ncbi:MAG: MFS transporter [Ardenticatenaceae bacterium]|nr:MFS transporter [Ardenticatenaceae bacterium]
MKKQTPKETNAMVNIFSIRDFKLLFIGILTSLLGDQFTLIATPWLVLQLTGDPKALGIVLALEGIPRALFMLYGGVVTDRFSPRNIMLVSDVARLGLVGLLATAVFTGTVQLWLVYAFSLGFGLVAGFAIPASNSIVPMIVSEKDLQAGNSVVMGIGQLMGFVGPVTAGILIGQYAESLWGVGLAFAIDAVTFAISAVTLWFMQNKGNLTNTAANPANEETAWAAIKVGLKYVWQDKALRLMFFIIAAVNFLFVGPMLVGIPVLADQQLPEGATAFGLLMSGFAGGNLVGFLVAGLLPQPDKKALRFLLLTLLTIFGAVLGVMGFINHTWVDFGLMVLLGLGTGYVTILLFTSIQARVPKTMLGRIMSLLMLSSNGLIPISQAISGVITAWSLPYLFVLAGGLLILVTLWTAGQPALGSFSEEALAQA